MADSVSGGRRERVKGRRASLAGRRFPIGAELAPGGGVHFRVWAPRSKRVLVRLGAPADFKAGRAREVELGAEGGGYFSGLASEAAAGWWYQFKLGGGVYPDPASRYQPEQERQLVPR